MIKFIKFYIILMIINHKMIYFNYFDYKNFKYFIFKQIIISKNIYNINLFLFINIGKILILILN